MRLNCCHEVGAARTLLACSSGLLRRGLTGTFDVELQWSVATAAALGAGGNTAGSDAPSILTAVQEQIGLKLEPAKTSVDYLVIDHLEPPEAN